MTGSDDPSAGDRRPGTGGPPHGAGPYGEHPGAGPGGPQWQPGPGPHAGPPPVDGPGGPGQYPPRWQPGPGQPPPPQWQSGSGGQSPQWQDGPVRPGPGGAPAKKNTGKIVTIVAAVAVVLAGAGVGIAAAVGAFSSSPEQQVDDSANALSAAADAGDAQKIFDMMCAEMQEKIEGDMADFDMTLEEFFDFENGVAETFVVTDVTVDDDGDSAVVTYDATFVWDGEEQALTDV